MTGADFERACAALYAWREARKEGFNGMLGVLFVLRNRAQAGWNDGNWLKIMEDMETSEPWSFPDTREPTFQRLLQWVDGVYDGTTEDKITNGALYHYNPILAGIERCAVVGGMLFYK